MYASTTILVSSLEVSGALLVRLPDFCETFGYAYTSLNERKRGPSSTLMRSFEFAKKTFGEPCSSGKIEVKGTNFQIESNEYYDADNKVVLITEYGSLLV